MNCDDSRVSAWAFPGTPLAAASTQRVAVVAFARRRNGLAAASLIEDLVLMRVFSRGEDLFLNQNSAVFLIWNSETKMHHAFLLGSSTWLPQRSVHYFLSAMRDSYSSRRITSPRPISARTSSM